jgi:hypothetical protein
MVHLTPDKLLPLIAGGLLLALAPPVRAPLQDGLSVVPGAASYPGAPLQDELSVVPGTASYPGAPRSVQVLDATLPTGQHIMFDTDLCRTFAWEDADGTPLAGPVPAGPRWPAPDITALVSPTDRLTADSDTWTNWEGGWRPAFRGYTTTADGVTFTCDMPASAGHNGPTTRYALAVTYTSATLSPGAGYTLTAAITPPAGVGGITLWTQQTGLGAVGGDATGLAAWAFDGDGYGVTEFPWVPGLAARDERSGGVHFWTILTHPQGTFVLAQPNLYDPAAFGDWHISSDGATPGFQVWKPTTGTAHDGISTSDPVAFLWRREPGRTVPQQYLDARYALLRDWLAFLQLGPQHIPLAREAGAAGNEPWDKLANPATYLGADGWTTWRQRHASLQNTLAMYYAATPGNASTIHGYDPLTPDMFYPNVSDLPGLASPPASGGPYFLGTFQDMRNGLDLARLLGMDMSFWSQWYYHGDHCPGSTAGPGNEFSRFDTSWPCSALFKQHPEFTRTDPDGKRQVAYQAPGVFDWMKDWTRQYWLDNGMQGRFIDTNAQIPQVYQPGAPLFLDFYIWTLRNGGYLQAENPQAFLPPLYYNQASPYAVLGREWGAPFAVGAVRNRTCLGIPNASTSFCDRYVAATGGQLVGTLYDVASARRMHAVGAALGMGGAERLQDERAQDAAASGRTESIKAEAERIGALQDRHGLPDRVELIGPRPLDATPYSVALARDVAPGDDPQPLDPTHPDAIWVMPAYQLPQAGRVQIDGEIIAYTGNYSDNGLNAGLSILTGVTRGASGTTPATHRAGAAVQSLDDQMHWTFDDAYWVYGEAPNEVWVKLSDESVWEQGGSTPSSLPAISDVQVQPAGSSATVTWTTDRPTTGWVEYDTYGNAEPYNSQRPASWWPNYLHKTDLADSEPPAPATTHQRTLTGLTPGATYHYRIVVRGPGQSVTPDATFVAG